MRFHITYLLLEIKRALKSIGYLLAGALLLSVVIAGIVFASTKILYKDQIVKRIQVAIVQEDNNKLTKLALRVIGSMDSVESFCDFVPMTEEEAVTRLHQGKLLAAMAVPEGMVEGIMDGRNIPVVVLLSDNRGAEGEIFKELTTSGAVTLGSAQAGIYAISDYLFNHGKGSSIEEALEILNERYLDYALSRNGYFTNTLVSATEDLTITQYYTVYGILLFTLLCGIPCAILLKEDSKSLQEKLSGSGIKRSERILAKIFSIGILLSAVLLVLGSIGLLLFYFLTGNWIGPDPSGIIILFIIVLTISSIIVLIYKISGNPVGGVMLLFLSTIFFIFCSGGFVPLVFLPEAVREIAPFLPTTILARGIGNVVTGIYSFGTVLEIMLMGCACWLLGTVVRRK
jgi:ABC-2 type transport system permease protein